MKSIFTDSDLETLREDIQAYMKQMPDCDELAEYKREVEEVKNDWAKLVDSGIFHDAADDVHALINTQNTGIQADIIVLCLAPGTAGVVLIVHTAALILFLQTGFGTLFGLTVQTHDTVGTELLVCVDEGVQHILTILQNIIGIAADDHAGTFLSQL
mgnify:CR=1 FL=1